MNNQVFKKIIKSGDVDAIKKVYYSNSLNINQLDEARKVLMHVNEIQTIKVPSTLTRLALLILVVLAAALFFTGCADTKTVTVEAPADIINNTYVTEILETYNVTNVTEQYITEEYVTNIEGAQIEIVPLCPNIPDAFPEVLLRIDGVLVAYFAQNGNALKARLVVVPENVVLQTTDGRANCKFKVIDGQIKEL